MIPPRRLIWIDALAGASAGVLVIIIHRWLADLFQLPVSLLVATGLANLGYGSVSFTMALCSRGDRVPFFRVIATANIAWAVVCVVLAACHVNQASIFGLAHLIGEACIVGGLGIVEWRSWKRYRQFRPLP